MVSNKKYGIWLLYCQPVVKSCLRSVYKPVFAFGMFSDIHQIEEVDRLLHAKGAVIV